MSINITTKTYLLRVLDVQLSQYLHDFSIFMENQKHTENEKMSNEIIVWCVSVNKWMADEDYFLELVKRGNILLKKANELSKQVKLFKSTANYTEKELVSYRAFGLAEYEYKLYRLYADYRNKKPVLELEKPEKRTCIIL